MSIINTLFKSDAGRIIYLFFGILVAYLKALANLILGVRKKSIRGQNVLITGGGGGLGRELALHFAAEGANLILVDMNETNLKRVKEEILKQVDNVRVLDYVVDIRSDKNVFNLGNQIRKDFGDVHILVNNAGIVQCLPFLELSPDLVERTFQVNSLAHIWTIREFLPRMIENNQGHIVAISSIAGLIGNKYLTDYCASKFAVVGLMEALDKELHDKNTNNYENIYLTTVCPSSMATKMFQTFTSRFVPNEAVDLVQEYLDYGVKPHKF
ncbi:Short-chain dehydrogenase/reductase family 16C member 6 [Fragariocoptes setiger]|uniref:Short-chain dehydrogenase/reductase family 16C member 6 n=1 Tax=Fragariocoptes setiger TaxID=1670756 RepID=A0ABQ7S7K1_9ACAR|nr:Short-chain dehydrogenase/reductase family 16C member 6 [Fragariocoptes setiger]